ncbi:hypothetical protein BJF95_08585 [Rhizobium oryziradicis]|uniref:Uncharacterized protein n=1 Tax=Rhizobium oryziradicis TaxID=1867956 RepID=A0A1Q8ZR75_9HYPH|nr:hypothetical protein BJF95_08585 [Rhizobium oryziradicis]
MEALIHPRPIDQEGCVWILRGLTSRIRADRTTWERNIGNLRDGKVIIIETNSIMLLPVTTDPLARPPKLLANDEATWLRSWRDNWAESDQPEQVLGLLPVSWTLS